MSTDKNPGMAVNEEKLAHHVSETREQAKEANYPSKPVALHAKARPRRQAHAKNHDRKPMEKDETG